MIPNRISGIKTADRGFSTYGLLFFLQEKVSIMNKTTSSLKTLHIDNPLFSPDTASMGCNDRKTVLEAVMVDGTLLCYASADLGFSIPHNTHSSAAQIQKL